MDEAGESGDPMDQFHRNEAIFVVVDDGFLAEEDDDYEDLYNDVNVGEGFLQSLRKNNDSGGRIDGVDEKKVQPGSGVQDQVVGVVGEGVKSVGGGGDESRVSERKKHVLFQQYQLSRNGKSKTVFNFLSLVLVCWCV